jgi:Flp pilus assembly protein TadG
LGAKLHWLWGDPARRRVTAHEQGSARRRFARLLQKFKRAQDGSVVIIAALLLPVLVGFTALVVEYGIGLMTRAENQRVADIAAFSGALEYSAAKSESGMRASALHAAKINGIDPKFVSVALVPAPRGTGDAVQVRITTTAPIVLATILGANSELLVSAQSYAAIGSAGEATCILALDGSQSGIVLSGGTSLTANTCAVASNASLTVPCGTAITTQTIQYNTSAPNVACSGLKSPKGGAPKIEKIETKDPLKDHAGVLSAAGKLATAAALPAVSVPNNTTGGPAIEFSWGDRATLASRLSQAGCTLSGNAPNFSVACLANTVNLGSISVMSVQVQFDLSAPTSRTFNVNGAITTSGGGGIAFGDGQWIVKSGILIQGNVSSFGKGRFWIGPNANTCSWNAGRHSVCVTQGGQLTFGGPSDFEFSGGLHAGDDSKLTLGSGTTNRFALGAANGVAMSLAGGHTTILADALGPAAPNWPNGNFVVGGTIDGFGGGSCLNVGASPQHYIKGNFIVSGALILGAGIYSIDGSFLAGGYSAGGSANCGGSVVSIKAEGVSVIVAGKNTPTSGPCANMTFCIGAGYGNIIFKAPTSGDMAGMAVIGPTNGNKSGAALNEGAGNAKISGAFYFPTGPIVMTGGSGVGGGGGDCFQLVGSRIELSGGTSAASDCVASSGGGASKRVVLVQ